MIQFQTNIKDLKSFQDVIAKLDAFGVGFLAIVDDQNTFIGIVTDGDIRKALLNQKKEVNEIINFNPITLPHTTPRHQIKSFLEEKRRLHVPLIDENKKSRVAAADQAEEIISEGVEQFLRHQRALNAVEALAATGETDAPARCGAVDLRHSVDPQRTRRRLGIQRRRVVRRRYA